jgi:hypothetical protein
VLAALGRDGQAVELTRQADCEVADVDHLLNLALALGDDLAGLDRHQPAERRLVRAQLLAEQPHQLAALRRGNEPPLEEGRMRLLDRRGGATGVGLANLRDHLAGDRRAGRERAALVLSLLDAQALQQSVDFNGEVDGGHVDPVAVSPADHAAAAAASGATRGRSVKRATSSS